MTLKFLYITRKDILTEQDEQYIIEQLNKGKLSMTEVMVEVHRPSVNLLNALFNASTCEEEQLLVCGYTPTYQIKQIDNVDYLRKLIEYDYKNFDSINFDKFTTYERVYDYAGILSSYELSVFSVFNALNKITSRDLDSIEQEHFDISSSILFEMEETFNTARQLLAGKISPDKLSIAAQETKKQKEEQEPNC